MKYSLRSLMVVAILAPPLIAGTVYLVSSFGGFIAFIGILHAVLCLAIAGYFVRQLIRLTRQ